MKLPYFSDDYEGEFVIHSVNLKDGVRTEDREWIPRTIMNDDHRGYAVVVGNGTSRIRKQFSLNLIENHSGGLLASKRIQTYGCNALYRDMKPSFLITMQDDITKEIADSGFSEENIVYTTAKNVVKYPGKFSLIPQNISYYNAGTVATYLACFDKHTEVYLLGFDGQPDSDMTNNVYADTPCYPSTTDKSNGEKQIAHMKNMFDAYKNVNFHWVMDNPHYTFPADWKWCKNVNYLTYREFISEMDLGVQLKYNWKT